MTVSIYSTSQNIDTRIAQLKIVQHVRERAARYDKIEITENLPRLQSFGEHMVWFGSWSRTIPTIRERYILKGSAIDMLTSETLYATPSEIARAWVYTSMKRKPRATKKMIEYWESMKHTAPLLSKPAVYPDMVYLDLQSAYWSILQVVGWGAEYTEHAIIRAHPVQSFPYPHVKMARNSLVSSFMGKPSLVWKDGKMQTVKTGGVVNRGIYYLCIDILQSIAIDMLEFDPVYINTDGYIIPQKYEEAASRKIDELYGLLLRRKHAGQATIYGVGDYSIGDHISHRNRRYTNTIDTINHRVPRQMFLKWFRYLSERFPPDYR